MKYTYSPDVVALNPQLQQAAQPSKYRNVPTMIDGIRFDSKKEATDYQMLKMLESAGQIVNLHLQPRFVLQEAYTDATTGAHYRAIEYVADFMWDDLHTGKTHVMDSKGIRTPVFKLKEKMFRQRYPQYIFEVG